MADYICERMGKDADVDTTEAADGLSAQIAVVHASKMGELFVIRRVIQMIELLIGGDAQIDHALVQRHLLLDMRHLADADLGL